MNRFLFSSNNRKKCFFLWMRHDPSQILNTQKNEIEALMGILDPNANFAKITFSSTLIPLSAMAALAFGIRNTLLSLPWVEDGKKKKNAYMIIRKKSFSGTPVYDRRGFVVPYAEKPCVSPRRSAMGGPRARFSLPTAISARFESCSCCQTSR